MQLHYYNSNNEFIWRFRSFNYYLRLPPGRKKLLPFIYDKNRLKVYGFLKDQIKDGKQIYIVYPLIEESLKNGL